VVGIRLDFMMRALTKLNTFSLRFFVLLLFLCAFLVGLSGCGYVFRACKFVDEKLVDLVMLGSNEEFTQLGETKAEGRRRHQRVMRINQKALMADLDSFFMVDEPSTLTDKRLR